MTLIQEKENFFAFYRKNYKDVYSEEQLNKLWSEREKELLEDKEISAVNL